MPYQQKLPDLAVYRRGLIDAGAPEVPPLVPFRAAGLLAELPKPPAGKQGWPWDRETPPPAFRADGPVISIVTPSYQQGDFLEETIRSVLLQNYPRLQFLVMDGGSTDESSAIIERYRPWLSFAHSTPDRGQSHALNLGFSIASGDYLGWLNSDDFYLPETLHRVAAVAQRTVGFIYGDSLAWDQAFRQMRHVMAGFAHARYASFPGQIPSHGAFWHREKHQPVWEEQICAMDYELWIRLLPGASCRYVPHPLGVLREHPLAKSHSASLRSHWAQDATRNGLAHPDIYTRGPWLPFEYRAVQRIVRAWRTRGEAAKLRRIQQRCGWDFQILASHGRTRET